MSPPAFTQSFGASCPTVGAITLTAQGAPSVGNAAFQLRCLGATAGRSTFFFLAVAPDAVFTAGNFSGSSACTTYLDLNNLIVPFPGLTMASAAPTTIQPIPIPNLPALSGIDAYAQVAELNGGTGAIKLSNGLLIALR